MAREVIVVRHAIAFECDRCRWPDDALRPLTPAGKAALPYVIPSNCGKEALRTCSRSAWRRDAARSGQLRVNNRAGGAHVQHGLGRRAESGATSSPILAGRFHTGGEIFSLDDYRNRYALYRLDPDLHYRHAIVWS